MYNLLSELADLVSNLLQGYCLQYFYGSFLESRISGRRRNGIFIAVLYSGLKYGMSLILPPDQGSLRAIVRLILTLFLLFSLALCFYRAASRITIFLVITFLAVSEISLFLAAMLFPLGNGLFDLLLWGLEKGYLTSVELYCHMIILTAYILQILVYAVVVLILYFSLKRIVDSFREKRYDIRRTELLFLITPSLTGAFICVLLRSIMFTVEDQIPSLLYDKYPALLFIVPAILVLSLLSILCSVRLFQDMIYLNREKNNRVILERQILHMQAHFAEIERVYAGIRSMKHDMKNTIAVLMQLANGNGEEEKRELKDYLSGFNRALDSLDIRFRTGNSVVDTLLNMKYHEIVRTMPELAMDAEGLMFPGTLHIQGYDIGIILGNALDNAVEACHKLKGKEPEADIYIRLSSYFKGKMLFIEAENSFDGTVRTGRSGFPETDKADREAHGIGLANIKSAAEKYGGAVDWSAKGRVFTLTVMLQNG